MPLSGWPASCLLPAHPTGVFPIRILCSEGMCVGFAFGGTARWFYNIFARASCYSSGRARIEARGPSFLHRNRTPPTSR